MVKSNRQRVLAGCFRPCLFCSRPAAHQMRELWLRRFRNCLVCLGLLLCYHVRPRLVSANRAKKFGVWQRTSRLALCIQALPGLILLCVWARAKMA
nr:putative integron gene cassette protein [uncultured bacterium]